MTTYSLIGITAASGSEVQSKIASGTTGQVLTATTGALPAFAAPAVINTARPAFHVTLSAQAANVTGDGTLYDIVWDTETMDQNGDYNTGTGVFTAPYTGLYHFDTTIFMGGLANNHLGLIAYFYNSRNLMRCNPWAMVDNSGNLCLSFSQTFKMTATGTTKVQIYVTGGNKTVDIETYSIFSGYLVC